MKLFRILVMLAALAAPCSAQQDLDVSVLEGNTLKVTMGPFTDLATGAPATPTSLTYRLDAPVKRGATNLLAPVTLTPLAPTVTVYIPHSAVRMYDDAVDRQSVELTVTWTSSGGHQGRKIARFEMTRSRFAP